MNKQEASAAFGKSSGLSTYVSTGDTASEEGAIAVSETSKELVTVSLDAEKSSAVLEKPKKQRRSRRQTTVQHKAARLIQLVTKTREYVNHTYHDLSDVPPEDHDLIKSDADLGDDIKTLTFNQKVYHILMQSDFQDWISWLPHGRSFRVDLPVAFEREVCIKYFGHKRYSSFLRQLNNHGYRHITQGPDRNTFYHEVSCTAVTDLFRVQMLQDTSH
jgi:hypothetical protein